MDIVKNFKFLSVLAYNIFMTKEWLMSYMEERRRVDGTYISNWWRAIRNRDDVLKFLYDELPNFRDNRFTFLTRMYCLINGIYDIPVCQYCKKVKLYTNVSNLSVGFRHRFCCPSHAALDDETSRKRIETCRREYGCDYVFQAQSFKDTSKTSCQKRYGADSWMASDIGKIEYKENIHALYGVDNQFQREEVKEKSKLKMLSSYGVDHPMRSDDIKAKLRETNSNRIGCEYPTQNEHIHDQQTRSSYETKFKKILANPYVQPMFTIDEYINRSYYTPLKWKCKQCGKEFETYVNWSFVPNGIRTLARCITCFPYMMGVSKEEQEVLDYVRSISKCEVIYQKDSSINRTVIPPYELDIWIPDLKIAIEFNGMYWHSKKHADDEGKPYVNKHLMKTIMCESLGIRLIHIYEDEWIDQNSRTRIKSLLDNYINNRFDFSELPDEITLCRDKFPETFTIPGYSVVERIPAKMRDRQGYLVYDCGMLVFRRDMR